MKNWNGDGVTRNTTAHLSCLPTLSSQCLPLDVIRHQAKRFQSDWTGEEGPLCKTALGRETHGKAHLLTRGKEEGYIGVLQHPGYANPWWTVSKVRSKLSQPACPCPFVLSLTTWHSSQEKIREVNDTMPESGRMSFLMGETRGTCTSRKKYKGRWGSKAKSDLVQINENSGAWEIVRGQ